MHLLQAVGGQSSLCTSSALCHHHQTSINWSLALNALPSNMETYWSCNWFHQYQERDQIPGIQPKEWIERERDIPVPLRPKYRLWTSRDYCSSHWWSTDITLSQRRDWPRQAPFLPEVFGPIYSSAAFQVDLVQWLHSIETLPCIFHIV